MKVITMPRKARKVDDPKKHKSIIGFFEGELSPAALNLQQEESEQMVTFFKEELKPVFNYTFHKIEKLLSSYIIEKNDVAFWVQYRQDMRIALDQLFSDKLTQYTNKRFDPAFFREIENSLKKEVKHLYKFISNYLDEENKEAVAFNSLKIEYFLEIRSSLKAELEFLKSKVETLNHILMQVDKNFGNNISELRNSFKSTLLAIEKLLYPLSTIPIVEAGINNLQDIVDNQIEILNERMIESTDHAPLFLLASTLNGLHEALFDCFVTDEQYFLISINNLSKINESKHKYKNELTDWLKNTLLSIQEAMSECENNYMRIFSIPKKPT